MTDIVANAAIASKVDPIVVVEWKGGDLQLQMGRLVYAEDFLKEHKHSANVNDYSIFLQAVLCAA